MSDPMTAVERCQRSDFSKFPNRRSPGSNLTTAIDPSTARTRLTQPATFSGTANLSTGFGWGYGGTSPLSGGR